MMEAEKMYQITSEAGVDYGLWLGGTPETAFRAMITEGGGGDPEATGTPEDWIIEEVVTA